MAVLDLLASLIMQLPFERRLLYTSWTILAVTFVASIVTVFVSCNPVNLHWRIYPDPGDCVIGALWIYTYEASNIVTDAMLMALSFSIVFSVRITLMQRARILLLFSVGIVLICISIVRILIGRDARTQAAHTLWSSLEVLLATTVAVTPTVYALGRNRREQNAYGHGTSPPPMDIDLNQRFSQGDDSSVMRIFVHAWNQDWSSGRCAPKI
ncbi:hypothetical protein ACEQ8H_008903 [Pleosporales sp. CAS-2024a]